jgi:hypothetical protein
VLRQAKSSVTSRNPDFTRLDRRGDEDNVAWGERAVADMNTEGPRNWTYVALLGGADTLSFRLRVAQSHLRADMQPSYWSDAVLVELATGKRPLDNAQAVSVPLAQPDAPRYAPEYNGVVRRPLHEFADSAVFPNIALIALPIEQAKIMHRVQTFERGRSTLDALEHVLRWLAFAWGVARTGNPLHENYGIPSACMLETVCAAENFDLTPGLESRASCPEAIWSAALYWHEFYMKTSRRVPCGRFTIGHAYPILEWSDRPAGPAGTERAASGGRTRSANRKPARRR